MKDCLRILYLQISSRTSGMALVDLKGHLFFEKYSWKLVLGGVAVSYNIKQMVLVLPIKRKRSGVHTFKGEYVHKMT